MTRPARPDVRDEQAFETTASGVSRRGFLAATFLTGAGVAAFYGPVGGVARPLPRPDLAHVFEPDVFEVGVFE